MHHSAGSLHGAQPHPGFGDAGSSPGGGAVEAGDHQQGRAAASHGGADVGVSLLCACAVMLCKLRVILAKTGGQVGIKYFNYSFLESQQKQLLH